MPIGPYADFDDCVAQNQDKRDPEGYCAVIKRNIEGASETSESLVLSDGSRLLTNIEIFKIGTHVPAQGEARTWTEDEVAGIVRAFESGVPPDVHVKLGHTTPEFAALVAKRLGVPEAVVTGEGGGDGQISLGRVVNLRLRGKVILADLKVPSQVADLVKKGYTDVSVELLSDFQDHKWVLSALALLGAERPAVGALRGLEEIAGLSQRKPALVYSFKVPNGTATIVEKPDGKKEGEMAMEADIRKLLGLDDKADVLETVKGLKEKAEKPAPVQVAQFTELQGRVQGLEAENAQLKKEKRIATFTERARPWAEAGAIADAAKTGAELAALPDDQGEKVAAAYGEVAKSIKKASLFRAVGTNRVGEEREHPVLVKMREWAKDNKTTVEKAHVFWMQNHPEEWQEYRAATRESGEKNGQS